MNLLKKIDTTGMLFSFPIFGNRKYKTFLGGMFTLSLFVSSILLFAFLGINFYKRINPSTSWSVQKTEKYFNYTINTTNFLFAFRVDDSNGQLVHRPDYFYFQPRYLVYSKNQSGNFLQIEEILDWDRCTEKDINNVTDFINLGGSNQWYCLKWPTKFNQSGLPVGGLYDGQLIQYIKIRLYSCKMAPKSHLLKYNISGCSNDNIELKRIFDNRIFFSVFIQGYFMNAEDYYDPLKLSYQNLYDTIDMSLVKKTYYYFKKGNLLDSKSWISEDFEYSEYYGFDRAKYDSYLQGDGSSNSFYCETNLYFDKVTETFKRRYMKIQELISSIGGLLNSISMAFSLFFLYYNSFYQYRDLLNNFFIIYEDGNNHSNFISNSSCIINMKENKNNPSNLVPDVKQQSPYKIFDCEITTNLKDGNENNPNKNFLDSDRLKISTIRLKNARRNNSIIDSKKPELYEKINLKKGTNLIRHIKSEFKHLNLSLGYFTWFRTYFCQINKKNKLQCELYKKGQRLISEKLDCYHILNHMRKVDNALNHLVGDNLIKKFEEKPTLYLDVKTNLKLNKKT